MDIKLIVFCALVVLNWVHASESFSDCPCPTADLCKPITKQYYKHMIVFGDATNGDWKKWNWTEITHVILVSTANISDLYCFAHSKNIYVTRVVYTDVTNYDQLMNESYRHQVISSWVDIVAENHLDGININLEGEARTENVVNGISALTQDAYKTLKQLNSNYVVTFDAFYSPFVDGCATFHCFNFTAISKACDYMIVTDYDGGKASAVAASNSPIDLITKGYDQYINELNIPAERLVMAIPWFGFDYVCSRFYNESGDDICMIEANLTTHHGFANISALYSQNIGGLKWWTIAKTPYFTIKQDNAYHQYQFDNVESLTYKLDLALQLGLKGIGAYKSIYLNYTSADTSIQKQTTAMWNTLTEYAQKLKMK